MQIAAGPGDPWPVTRAWFIKAARGGECVVLTPLARHAPRHGKLLSSFSLNVMNTRIIEFIQKWNRS